MARRSAPEVVVVTGASAGVGRATVRRLARDGARIGLLAREPDRLERTRAEVADLGGMALALPTDVADAAAVEAAAEAVENAFGPIDVWINNAIVTVLSPFEEMSVDEFRRVVEVDFLGTVHGTRAALRRMRPRDHGCIVQVGSALAYRSIPLQSAYCASKAAIRGFTDALRCELRHQRSAVRLTMVQLPAVDTPQFEWCRTRMEGEPQPVPPIFEPEVAARAVVWAARHRRRELIVGASTLLAVLGQRIAPGLMDRYLASRGYDAQVVGGNVDAEGPSTDGPGPPHRAGNLFEPVEGPYAARGRFDPRSHEHSPHLQLSMRRRWIALGLGAAAGIGALLRARS